MAAQDGVLIPVQCEYLALEGLGQLTQTIDRVKSALAKDLKIRGVILTMYDARTNLSADVIHEVKRFFGKQVFDSVVPRSIRLAEAPPMECRSPFMPPAPAEPRPMLPSPKNYLFPMM